jgi:hypothetical protein
MNSPSVQRTVGDIGARRLTVTTAQPPPPIVPKINSSRGVQLLDIDPEELARQLAIFEANLYNRIKPVDCLDTAWSRSNREDGANIKAMILTSNRMAAWVAQAILTHIDAKKRAQVMKYFLQVADVSMTTPSSPYPYRRTDMLPNFVSTAAGSTTFPPCSPSWRAPTRHRSTG